MAPRAPALVPESDMEKIKALSWMLNHPRMRVETVVQARLFFVLGQDLSPRLMHIVYFMFLHFADRGFRFERPNFRVGESGREW